MSDLHERLAALAEDAPATTTSPDPGDLWRRGRRHRVRSLAATGATAALVAAVAAVGVTAGLQRAQTLPEPAAPTGSELRLPDTFYGPGRWLSLLGRVGEGDTPGPLVALMNADVGTWTGVANGYVAVSADQEYRVLDLPDGDTVGAQPSLSPDGRYVVYWTSSGGEEEPADLTGLAAYDTETGEVDRIAARGGSAEFIEPARWIGDTVLFQEPDQAGSSSSTDRTTARAWTMGDDAAVAVDDRRGAASMLPADQTTTPVVVEVGVLRLLLLSQPADLGAEPVTRVDRTLTGNVVVSPDGTRIAAAVRPTGGGQVLAVGDLAAGTTTLTRVPDVGQLDGPLIGWRDDETVVTSALSYGGELTAIDVATGKQTTLATSTRPAGLSVQLAADAVTAPVTPGVEPSSPPDPRWVAASAAVLAAGLWLVLVRWRGRRRVR